METHKKEAEGANDISDLVFLFLNQPSHSDNRLMENMQMVFPQEENPLVSVNISLAKAKQAYAEFGIVPLRELGHETKLVIGCGNKPCVDCGGYKINSEDAQDTKYQDDHTHQNAITINPDAAFNPTVIAFFGKQPIAGYLNRKFDEIIIEGINLLEDGTLKANPHTLPDLINLLSPTGRIIISHGNDEKPHAIFSLADLLNWQGLKPAPIDTSSSVSFFKSSPIIIKKDVEKKEPISKKAEPEKIQDNVNQSKQPK